MMNSIEFKYWFEGICEGIDSTPTKEQWEKIKGKISEIEHISIPNITLPYPYYPYYPYPCVNPTYQSYLSGGSESVATLNLVSSMTNMPTTRPFIYNDW